MPRFVQFKYENIPEVNPDNDSRWAQEYAARLCDYSLAAFIMRSANVQHQIDRGPAVPLGSSTLAVRGCISILTRRMGQGIDDYGPHIDDVKGFVAGHEELINLNTLVKGVADVSVVRAWPEIATADLPLLGDGSPEDEERLARFKAGEIDSELFDPTCLTATLRAGDVLAKLDYRTPHDVRTVNDMRVYSSGLYPAILLQPH